MSEIVATGQSMTDQIKQAIKDYGPVVGLNIEGGNSVGSLSRIESVLFRASRSGDQAISALASAALSAVLAREKVNGTAWEEANQEAFVDLTSTARSTLNSLYASL